MHTQIEQQERIKPLRVKRNLLELGVKDGVLVRHDDDGYQIQMPDRYDLYYSLVGKNKPGTIIEKVAPLDETQRVKDVVISIPLESLDSRTIEQVGTAISFARKTNIEMQDEIVKQDIYQISWKMVGQDYEKKGTPKVEQGKTTSIDAELIAVGKYYVTVKDLSEQSEKPIIRIIPTHRILKFADGDFKDNVDRVERVKERLGISSKDFSGGDINDGIKKTMHFDHRGNCTLIQDVGIKDTIKQSIPIDINIKQPKKLEMAMH